MPRRRRTGPILPQSPGIRRYRTSLRTASLAGLLSLGLACETTGPVPAPPPPAQGPFADLVLRGGQVLTLDAGSPRASAVAVRGSKVVEVGPDEAVERWIGADTRVVELGGRTVVPGLVDSHMHLAGLGARRFGIDLVGTSSLEEVKQRVAAVVARARPGEWVRGRGWDQNDWAAFRKKGLKFPTAEDLDEVSPENPVVLQRIDGHALWANSQAMALAGIDKRARSKAGGEIVKQRGRPTGIFIDNAMELVDSKVPPLSAEALERALLLAQDECLAAGLTQVHDMGVDASTLAALEKLDADGRLKLRVYALHEGNVEDLGAALARGPKIAGGAERLTVRGVKFYLDGALGSRGAALLEPYADDKKSSGLLLLTPEVFEARVQTARERGFQVATHAIGDRANRIALDVYGRVFGADRGARPRVEHAQVIHPDDLPRFAGLGVIASMQPTHATSDMPWAEQRLGPGRLAGAYAWQSLLTRGATIAAGSDAPVEDISPILGLYAAITRKDLFGAPEGGWRGAERMSPEQALSAFTRAGAFASFREDEAGRIAVGRIADLTVLDQSPLEAPEESLATLRVEHTVVGGELVFSRERARP
jgi:predicted amidohydrolase YtcJ